MWVDINANLYTKLTETLRLINTTFPMKMSVDEMIECRCKYVMVEVDINVDEDIDVDVDVDVDVDIDININIDK